MSDTPCLESDNHPHPGDALMKFKVEFYIDMTEDDAKEMAVDESTEDEYADDPVECTEQNLEYQIENLDEMWVPYRVTVVSL